MNEQLKNPGLQFSLPKIPRSRRPVMAFVMAGLLVAGAVALGEIRGWSWQIIGVAILAGLVSMAWETRTRRDVLVALAGRPRSGKSYLLGVCGKAQELSDGRRFRLAPANQNTAALTNKYRTSLASGEPLPPNVPHDFKTLSFYVEEHHPNTTTLRKLKKPQAASR